MIKRIEQLLDNIYIKISGVLAIILSPFVDAIGSPAYWYLFVILFLFLVFGISQEWKKVLKLSEEIIHIPIVIKIDDGPDLTYVIKNLMNEIEKENGIKDYENTLKKYLGINIDSLIYEYKGSFYDFDRLISFSRIIKFNINKISTQLNGKVKFHIAYYRRPCVGFMLGTIFRTEGICVYQNNDSNNKFYKIADINNREYKTGVNKFEKYDINFQINDKKDEQVLVVIESSSHYVAIKTSNLNEYSNIVRIRLIEGSTIPYESDWILYAREIYTILNKLQTEYKKIIIAHSMPESLAIILGMAIENYWDLSITQYENNSEYRFVYNLKDIKYF